MSIRVRKLSKQLGKPTVELLGILKALGFDRYKSPEDMLSDAVEGKLRSAVKRGVKPEVVELERVRKPKAAEAQARMAMDVLVPGVVRQVDERFDPAVARKPLKAQAPAPPTAPGPTSAAPAAPVAAVPATPAPAPDPAVAQATAALKAALEAERAALEAERRALQAERDALQAERAAWEATRRVPSGTSLADVLRDRGLVGVDEAERAIRALAGSRRIGEMLPFLSTSDPEGLQRWLRDVLVLVDGPPPEALESEAMVSVAPERSEIPGAAAWRRLATGLSEKLLLHGARRVLVVGGPVRAHRLLRQGLDPRVDLRFRPGARVVGPDAEADVTRTDAVALWEVEEDERAREVYDTSRAVVARIRASDVRSFVEEWIRALTE